MENKKYQVVPFGQERFAIADPDGKVIDDSQGYGYRTRLKAHLAYSWNFGGGKEKHELRQIEYEKWLAIRPLHAKIVKKFIQDKKAWAKELSVGDVTIKELWGIIEKEENVIIPDFVKKQRL